MNRLEQLAAHSKDYARLLLTIGENQVELLVVELQEELRHLLHMIMLMFAVAVFGLLAGIALTAALALIMKYPPATVLLCMTGIYMVAGVVLYWRIARLLDTWEFIGDTINQLRKDRPCSERSTE